MTQKPVKISQLLTYFSKYALVVALVLVAAMVFSYTRAHAYVAEDVSGAGLKQGTLVSIKGDGDKEVELADVTNAKRLYGVVTDGATASVRFTEGTEGEISVATSGEVLAFVSDINGEVKAGDVVGASWIKGVGMRVDSSFSGRYLGIALEDLTGSELTTYENLDTPTGKKDVKVGALRVRILTGNLEGQTGSSFLQQFASSLTGKDVSTLRVTLAVIIFAISLILTGVFVSNSIRGGFVSIGRNPLAANRIFLRVTQLALLTVLILIAGVGLSYAALVL